MPYAIICTKWRMEVIDMDARQQRGLEIAARSKITKKDDIWLVPSQSLDGEKYAVIPGLKCSCPDHEVRQVKCKHMWAVEYVLERETASDGTVTERVKVTTVIRKTYPQNWTAYNAAQSEEKTRFTILLADLCKGIPQPIHEGRGRPTLPLADMLFASAYKVYTGFSSRRFTSDLRDAKIDGLVNSTPHFNSVTNYLSDPDMTPILKHLIAVSSLPLKAIETNFAVDSSGFTTSRFISSTAPLSPHRLLPGSGSRSYTTGFSTMIAPRSLSLGFSQTSAPAHS
jgi:hypothetical protein